jgi:hypothetical protein
MVHLLQPFGLFAGEVRRLERILRTEVMALTVSGPDIEQTLVSRNIGRLKRPAFEFLPL